ncbi:uncharacterized protein LOC110689142 isoform X2 [Chenopodium quinoa]|uniref:uncharacterized protein LOC110689142 isoform X2 n=1 Tax=Chenopodium quinoa TaxID=63459 RepID=UPI000B788DEC|nr:uncharacterized protein LOC110689142 isoform X2 [Chenopodium quinoa]
MYTGSCRRIMLDNTFSDRLMREVEAPDVAAKKHDQSFNGLGISDIGVVFVPNLQKDHWWCAVFEFQNECVWYIDTMFSDLIMQHREVLEKLICDSKWEGEKLVDWKTDVVKIMELQSCGVIMLCSIKERAYQFTYRFGVGRLDLA